jgi:hypothetical protein
VTEVMLPHYPVYVPSKGRADNCLTARFLRRDGVPFFLVVEPQEVERYAAQFGRDCLLVLPGNDLGSVVPARNFIKEHATAAGFERHWQLDDNIRGTTRRFQGYRVPCHSGYALRVTEIFTDRYENIAIAGLTYEMFLSESSVAPPFHLNCHVYSCVLIWNALPYGWRGVYNEDTDICLRVLADGYCTVALNAFTAIKKRTLTTRGGNTDTLYQGDGRLKMARSLERQWPGVVTTYRRFQRPQHRIAYTWGRFTTPLQLKEGIDLDALPPVEEFGAVLQQVAPIQSPSLQRFVDQSGWEVQHVEAPEAS